MAYYHDLFNGLIKDKWDEYRDSSFWDAYEDLNNLPTLDDTFLWHLQTSILKQREDPILSTNQAFVNKFLTEIHHEPYGISDNDNAITNIYGEILKILNSVYFSSESNIKGAAIRNGTYSKEINYSQAQENSLEHLTSLLKKANVSQPLSASIVTEFKEALQAAGSTGGSLRGDYIKKYTQTKALLAEQLAVDAINNDPEMLAVLTGQWVDSAGKMLLQDAMAFNKSSLSQKFAQGSLNFSIKIKNDSTNTAKIFSASSLGEFFNIINKYSNKQYTIKLSDSLYDVLKEQSKLMAQVKSSLKNISLLNMSKNQGRNSISLEQLGTIDSPGAYLRLLKDLALNNSWYRGMGSDITEQNSQELNALANYSLSKNIALTNISANQVYLTELGFTTASKWMELRQRMLKFSGGIYAVNKDLLTTVRNYAFYTITN